MEPEPIVEDARIPLGITLTGYRLFVITTIIALGTAKLVASYRTKSIALATLDWTLGGFLGSLCVLLSSSVIAILEGVNHLEEFSSWACTQALAPLRGLGSSIRISRMSYSLWHRFLFMVSTQYELFVLTYPNRASGLSCFLHFLLGDRFAQHYWLMPWAINWPSFPIHGDASCGDRIGTPVLYFDICQFLCSEMVWLSYLDVAIGDNIEEGRKISSMETIPTLAQTTK
jgi:hypothetical protein